MSFLKKWIRKLRKLIFTYEDGFFIFPIFASDPESIIYGFQHTPMLKYYPEKQLASSRTPFMDGDAYFQKIEKGLWVICTNVHFKKNVCFRNIHYPDRKSDFYTLSLDKSNLVKNTLEFQNGEEVKMNSYYWRLLKPDAISMDYHYKETSSQVISIYAHKDWFQSNILANESFNKGASAWFEDPNQEILFLPQSSLIRTVSVNSIFDLFEKQDEGKVNMLELRSSILSLMNAFISELNKSGVKGLHSMKPKDEARIIRAAQMLKENIYNGFPSIEKIAKEVGVSETKLKKEFKAFFGKTLFQFFSETQMDVAECHLKESKESIKSIANRLGYNHPGKFTAAFKKIKKISPSEIRSDSDPSRTHDHLSASIQ